MRPLTTALVSLFALASLLGLPASVTLDTPSHPQARLEDGSGASSLLGGGGGGGEDDDDDDDDDDEEFRAV
ncbi:MAG TPA: hypothetical protein VLQ93_09890 [Myxococcaceae bacterium]|nr:hypothetical protein [Myxococcaceae bacterium]